MNAGNKRAIIAASRRAGFTGITLFAVWLILLVFRGIVPAPANFGSEPINMGNSRANSESAVKITNGSDGNMWFIQPYADEIGKISVTTGNVTEYNIPHINDTPSGIISGPDENLWLTLGNNIGKMSPKTGSITEYPVHGANAYPSSIVTGPDGNLWFACGKNIGKIVPKTGTITQYPIPGVNAYSSDITTDSDGNIWFIESSGNKIGTISPATGTITEYDAPVVDFFPIDITAGPDGNLWFTSAVANQIDKLSPETGSVTEYNIPTANAGPSGIITGHDGYLWFTESYANQIGKISPKTGIITGYIIPSENVSPSDLAAGPDGSLWFAEANANQIGKFTPASGEVTEYPVPLPVKTNIWDWSNSNTYIPVSTIIKPYVGETLRAITVIGLMSLLMAAILLFFGVFISAATKKPGWLVKFRGVLRLVLVGTGAAIPLIVVGAFIAVFILKHESLPSQTSFFGAAFFCSLLPAWLLVQTGYGILSNRTENSSFLKLTQQISVRLFIRLLKLVGLIIVANIIAGWFLIQQGLGLLLIQRLAGRDFPVIFGIVWVMAVIMVLAKLAADLVEIAYNHFTGQTDVIEQAAEKRAVKTGIPKGWLIFSLGLCAFILLVAVFGPLLAPNAKMLNLQNILQSPSAKHLLGTDQLGRDIFSRLLAGIRTDLVIGLAVASVVSIIAIGWAMLAAHCKRMNNWRGDTLEDIVLLPKDIICAVPWLVLLLLFVSLPGNKSVILITLVVALVILPRTVSVLQEALDSLTERKGRLQKMLRITSIAFIFTTAGVIFYVALLSFLGFGIPPGVIELGNLANSGTAFTQQASWLLIEPLVVLSLILIIGVVTGEAMAERFGLRSGAFWSKMLE
jgi:streptogramin lyase/ABC-type dipeptide/oligopeptide/nickel transport system permease subunit